MLLKCSWVWIYSLESGQPTQSHTLKENSLSLSHSYQLPTDPQLELGLLAHFCLSCWAFVLLGISQVLCLLSQMLCIHMCSFSVVSRQHDLLASTSGSYNLSLSVLQWSLSFGRRGYDTLLPFRAEHSLSTLLLCMSLWVNHPLLHKEVSLVKVERCTTMGITSQFNTSVCGSYTDVGITLGGYGMQLANL